jgi:hypothetical protein
MSQNEFSGSVRTGPVISASQSDIPQSFMSSNAPRPMAGRIAQKLAIASTSSQGASGTVLIPLGCGSGQGFIKSGTAYLRFNVAVAGGANSYGFNMTGDAQAVIQRATIYLNGQIAEQINNYNRIQGALDTHGLNFAYADSDLAVMSLKGLANTDYTASVNVTIPLKLGLLNAQQDLPLFLFNTAQLEFNLESLNNAIFSVTSSQTGYTVSNVQLIYSVFYPEQEYEMSMRQVLASGKLFQIPIKTWYNLQVSNSGALKSVPIGLNMSSVLGVFHFVNNTPTVELGPRDPVLYTGDTPAQQGLRVFIDGNLVNSYSIQDSATIFCEMKKALNLFADPDRSSYSISANAGTGYFNPVVNTLNQTTFLTPSFFGGLSLARTFESGLAMIGTAVGQMIVEVNNAGTATSTLHICTAYEQILTVDATGSIALIR